VVGVSGIGTRVNLDSASRARRGRRRDEIRSAAVGL